MPDKNVQAPDGSVIAFPDGMSDDDISAVMRKQYPNPSEALTQQTNVAAGAAGIQNPGVSKPPIQPRGMAGPVPASMYLRARQEKEGKVAPSPQPLGIPLMPIAAGAASLPRFLASMASGYAGSKGAQYGAQELGLSPAAQNWARDLGGLAAGSLPFLRSGAIAARDSLQQTGYTPEGNLSPGVNALLHPTTIPEFLFRKFVPQPTEFPSQGTGAPLPASSEFYEQRGAQLAKRPDELTQAVREGRAAKLPTRVKIPSPPEAASPSPFQGMQSTSPQSVSSLPPLAANPAAAPAQQPNVQMVSKFAPQKSLIQDPDSPPPNVRVTYQSVPQNDLLRLVMGGDRQAILEWQRRGLQLPDNVGFMTEGGAGNVPWRRFRR